jgi:hypothetical protein
MKRIAVLLSIWLTGYLAFAQESEIRQPGSFKGVKVEEAIDVYIKKGDRESIKVEVTGTNIKNVMTEVSGGHLKIHMASGNYRNRSVKVYVTYVQLEKITAYSASNVFSEGTLKASALELHAASAAVIELTLDGGELRAHAGSAGNINLEGKAKRLVAEASSAGSIDAYNLEAEVVEAEAESAGSIRVNVGKEIQADASSGGSIRYRGNPIKTNTHASSGGSVKKAN